MAQRVLALPMAVFLCPACAGRAKTTWKNPGTGQWACSGCGGKRAGVAYLRLNAVRALLARALASGDMKADGVERGSGVLLVGADMMRVDIEATLQAIEAAGGDTDRMREVRVRLPMGIDEEGSTDGR